MDKFNKVITGMMLEDPELLDALSERISKQAGYSIPTGDIRTSVYNIEDANKRDRIIKVLKAADNLTIRQLCTMLYDVKALLDVKKVKGKELEPYEKTLNDIDLLMLASYTLIIWQSRIEHS